MKDFIKQCLESGTMTPESIVEAVSFLDSASRAQADMQLKLNLRAGKAYKKAMEQKRAFKEVADLAIVLTRNAKS